MDAGLRDKERFRHPLGFPLYLFTNSMSSDDVISHIIRKIVQNSTQLLKSESDKSKKLMSQSSGDLKEPAEQQQPITETPILVHGTSALNRMAILFVKSMSD